MIIHTEWCNKRPYFTLITDTITVKKKKEHFMEVLLNNFTKNRILSIFFWDAKMEIVWTRTKPITHKEVSWGEVKREHLLPLTEKNFSFKETSRKQVSVLNIIQIQPLMGAWQDKQEWELCSLIIIYFGKDVGLVEEIRRLL